MNDGEARTTNYFYIAESNRSCGIRVEDGAIGQDGVSEGQAVTVSGIVRQNTAGERYIELNAVPSGSDGTEIEPLATNSKAVLNDQLLVGELVRIGRQGEASRDGRPLAYRVGWLCAGWGGGRCHGGSRIRAR